MTTPSTTEQQDTSLTRDLIYAARYYLGRPRILMTLATVAIVAGLALNWTWLVAVGLAPILLSVLPCLIMCAFGVCMICRSAKEQSAPVRETAQAPLPAATLAMANDNPAAAIDSPVSLSGAIESAVPAKLGASAVDEPSGAVASCCQSQAREATPPQMNDLQPSEERKVPNA